MLSCRSLWGAAYPLGACLFLAGAASAQMPNDSCDTPDLVNEGFFSFGGGTAFTNNELTCTGSMPSDLFWVYTATYTGQVTIDTEGSTFDTTLAVYTGSNCAEAMSGPCWFDNNSGAGNASSLTLSVTQGTQYMIQVANYPFPFGSGQLNIYCSEADPSPGNTDCASALQVTEGTYSGLVYQGHPDFYRATVPPGYALRAQLTNNPIGLGAWRTYDANTCMLTAEGAINATYYYAPNLDLNNPIDVVWSWGGALDSAACRPYDLDVSFVLHCAAGLDDAYSPNHNSAQAFPVDQMTSFDCIYRDGFIDYWSATIPPGETVEIDVLFATAEGNINIILLDSFGGAVVFASSSTDNESIIWTNTSGSNEEVRLLVQASPGQCNEYTLSVCGLPDEYESNDSCATPTPISPGLLTANVDFGDSDYYQISVPPGSSLEVWEQWDSNETNYNLYEVGVCSPLLGLNDVGFSYFNSTGVTQDYVIEAYKYAGDNSRCSRYAIDVQVVSECGPDDGFEDNDTCDAPAAITPGVYGGQVAWFDTDWYSITVPATSTLSWVEFSDSNFGVSYSVFDATGGVCGGLLAGPSSDGVQWTNTDAVPREVRVHAEMNPVAGNCSLYDFEVHFEAGSTFCDPMNPNSTGASTRLWATGNTGIEAGLHLHASDGPPFQSAYFLLGHASTDPGFPLANGRLCLTTQIERYNIGLPFSSPLSSIGQFNPFGDFYLNNGLMTAEGFDVPLQIPSGGIIQSGQTWHFQLWHRDNAAGLGQSNFSNGLSYTFP